MDYGLEEVLLFHRGGLLVIGSSLPALACGGSNHDENNHEIKVQAPIDAIDCTAMTITVLGLTMDITNVSIDGEANHSTTRMVVT